MKLLVVLSLFLLATAPVTWSRGVAKEERERDSEKNSFFEPVQDFGGVEKKLDTFFETVDDVISERTQNIATGQIEDDDELNEKLYEVITDAEDLDDDIAEVVEDAAFDKSEESDLELMQADATLLANDATRLTESVDTNRDGSKRTKTDPLLKREMELVKEKAEDVIEAFEEAERKVKQKKRRKGRRKSKGKGKKKYRKDDMEGAQQDSPYVPKPPTNGVLDHPSLGIPVDTPAYPDMRGGIEDLSSENDPAEPDNRAAETDARMGHTVSSDNEDDARMRSSVSSDETRQPPVIHPAPPDADDNRRRHTMSSEMAENRMSRNMHSDRSSPASYDPMVLARLEARRRELEREEELRRLAMERNRDPPVVDPRTEASRRRSSFSGESTRRESHFDFDEGFGRSNRQYFDTGGLQNYLDDCTDCVGMSQETTCPLNDQVLELKKWANELQELLSFGCKKPENCKTPGICCVHEKYPFEQTVVQMTQMLKDVYNLLQDRCSKGCYGGTKPPPSEIVEVPLWAPWAAWTPCDVTCGQGLRERSRVCSVRGRTGEELCTGLRAQTEICVQPPCCVDGNWASWSRWSQCSATCGRGVSNRVRGCTDPAPNFCGVRCQGQDSQSRPCDNPDDCCVDGDWGTWTRWSSCSASCGSGTRSRIRRCDSPSPNYCGVRCSGPARDVEQCEGPSCCVPVNGNWGRWANWESCSTTCGRGNQLRRRRCDDPAPNSCGRSCPGTPMDIRDCNDGPCCVDGNWGMWQRWSQCSVTCGFGYRTKTRSCDSPAPDRCGRECVGMASMRETCDSGVPCRVCVNGNWGTWERWSQCSVSCGQGVRERMRACDNPAPNFCGTDCFGSPQAIEQCDSGISRVDGNWASWSTWSQCSATCGRGERERRRSCNNPVANACGRECVGDPIDLQMCDAGRCIDCDDVRWDSWSTWSRCSATCGTGLRKRSRVCRNPYPLDCRDEFYCLGDKSEEEPCGSGIPCCDDVRWGSWSTWSRCSATCDTGLRKRTRVCRNPYPGDCRDEFYCLGDKSEEEPCGSGIPCCENVTWSSWSSWGGCTSTCGRGVQERNRQCRNAQAGCENSCLGAAFDRKPCNNLECCDRVRWTSWNAWTSCSATCGQGVQERLRDCVNPFPDVCGDENCRGTDSEDRQCDAGLPCCVDGNWGSWQRWSACSVTCGFGTRERRRLCDNPANNFCGRTCSGREYETDVCQKDPCITCVDGNWGLWESWSTCSVTCGDGSRERRRRCNNPPPNFCGARCDGKEFETDTCRNSPCGPACVDGNWGFWTPWSTCPVTCGRSMVERYRICDSPAPNVCGDYCSGKRYEEKSVLCGPLAIDGNWSQWGTWSACSATCGAGQQIRSRLCNSPAPNACGTPCLGNDEDLRGCEDRPCELCAMRDWTEWSRWGSCSATCGYGVRYRNRYCEFRGLLNANEIDCGPRSYENCRGESRDEEDCRNLPDCPAPSEWSSWGSCSLTCRGRDGVRERVLMVRMPNGQFESDETRTEREACSVDSPECPAWGSWTQCSATCRGRGVRERRQYIRTPLGVLEADASQVEREACSVDFPECPPVAEWGSWGACSATCRGFGVKERRLIFRSDQGGIEVDASQVETERCQVYTPECPSWGAWSSCSATCRGEGIRERRMVMRTNLGSIVSDSSQVETEICEVFGPDCPTPAPIVTAFWGTWEKWCPCDCKKGKRSRRRECVVDNLTTGNRDTVSLSLCRGISREERDCDVIGVCPECITSCQGRPDGVYASCTDCSNFIRCRGGFGEENIQRCSKPNSEFDAFVAKCVTAPSPSCSLQDCVNSCIDEADGLYHSCSNCSSYVRCDSGRYEEISCPDSQMEFNAHFGTCIGTMSPTCKRVITMKSNSAAFDALVNDAPADAYYDEKNGMTAEQRREMYEKTRVKSPAELEAMTLEGVLESGQDGGGLTKSKSAKVDPFDIELENENEEDEDEDDADSEDVDEGGIFLKVKEYFAGVTSAPDVIPGCRNGCEGAKRGRHPSCKGCEYYWQCYRSKVRLRKCTKKKMWDNAAKACLPVSSTCPGN